LLTFSDEVHVRRDFTNDADSVFRPLRNLHVDGSGACTPDAIEHAMNMLAARPKDRRRILFPVAKKRDRAEAQRRSTTLCATCSGKTRRCIG
jgi:hypothetical protein